MAQNITIAGASYPNVPSIDVPKTGGGTATFVDTSDATAFSSDIKNGKTAYIDGEKITGTADICRILTARQQGIQPLDPTSVFTFNLYDNFQSVPTHLSLVSINYDLIGDYPFYIRSMTFDDDFGFFTSFYEPTKGAFVGTDAAIATISLISTSPYNQLNINIGNGNYYFIGEYKIVVIGK